MEHTRYTVYNIHHNAKVHFVLEVHELEMH